MKNIILLLSTIFLIYSCQTDEINEFENSKITKRGCATHEVLTRQINENPDLAVKISLIEDFTANAIKQNRNTAIQIAIPVVVNVLYKTSSENISDNQIQSQINILNEDFNALNSDIALLPSIFENLKADVNITFVLDQINRKFTKKRSWGTRDAMKISKRGGIDATNPENKLNIWVCTIGNNILGYAQFPGGNLETDGIVVDSRYFGLSGNKNSPFNLGRTATHEVGHWLNLRHIWGDSTCGNDYVDDTPQHDSPNYGNPSFPQYSNCFQNPIEMTMNFMDYTNDNAMYMFTLGQKSRIDALFLPGGARQSFTQ